MIRTQIYLTEQEQIALKALTRQTGKSQSELIRDAVDSLIARFDSGSRLDKLRTARGMWKDHVEICDFEATRQSLNRS
jgi:hypothetical protein